jgi:hypothetical protein
MDCFAEFKVQMATTKMFFLSCTLSLANGGSKLTYNKEIPFFYEMRTSNNFETSDVTVGQELYFGLFVSSQSIFHTRFQTLSYCVIGRVG